jgi:hypothetical protein
VLQLVTALSLGHAFFSQLRYLFPLQHGRVTVTRLLYATDSTARNTFLIWALPLFL